MCLTESLPLNFSYNSCPTRVFALYPLPFLLSILHRGVYKLLTEEVALGTVVHG